jgi:hypothetical protein
LEIEGRRFPILSAALLTIHQEDERMDMKNQDAGSSQWHDRATAQIAENKKRAAAHYAREMATSALLREMVDLQERGLLTEAKWIECRDRGLAINRKYEEFRCGGIELVEALAEVRQ